MTNARTGPPPILSQAERETIALCIEATKANDHRLARALRDRLLERWYPPVEVTPPAQSRTDPIMDYWMNLRAHREYEQIGWLCGVDKSLKPMTTAECPGGPKCKPVYVKKSS